MKTIYFTALFTLLLFSCKKTEGYGGNAAITGKLEQKNYSSDFSISKGTNPVSNSFVYILFGESNATGDRVKTNYDGTFSFTHLAPGKYFVYAYSKDTTMASSEDVAIIKEVEITKNKEVVELGTIQIAENNPSGNASIYGKVKMTSSNTGNSYYKSNQYVYLIPDNETKYSKSIKTNYNGEYLFENLPIGSYKVYTYSNDVYNVSPATTIPVIDSTVITSINQKDSLNDLVIYY